MFSGIEQRNNIYRDVSYEFGAQNSQQVGDSNYDEQNASSQHDNTLDKSQEGSNNND